MLDLIVKDATIVDGTGGGKRQGNIGVRDGRIVGVGAVDDLAERTIDATGLVACPGFVDVHTHYDAQVFWDPLLSPSTLHGVTTVVGGNCGFTIAPMEEADGDYLIRMLAFVEGMPLEALRTGVPWGRWRTFGEWISLLEGQVGPNVAFMAGHSTIRRLVLGEDAHACEPTEGQLVAMERHLREALEAGALGLSSSNGKSHLDGDGNFVPSRCAGDPEFERLASVVGDLPGTSLEYTLSAARLATPSG